jgi:hypothetical protein
MKHVRLNVKTPLIITLAIGCCMEVLLWPEWRVALAQIDYSDDAANAVSRATCDLHCEDESRTRADCQPSACPRGHIVSQCTYARYKRQDGSRVSTCSLACRCVNAPITVIEGGEIVDQTE